MHVAAWPDAMARGQTIHRLFQSSLCSNTPMVFKHPAADLVDYHSTHGRAMPRSYAVPIIAENKRNDEIATAWWDAIQGVTLDPNLGTDILGLFPPDQWEVVGRPEFPLYYQEPDGGPAFYAPCDMLMFHKQSQRYWILDLKTTGALPSVKLSGISRSFQTQLYCYLLSKVLPDPNMAGGLLHVALQTPPIVPSFHDRSYRWRAVSPTDRKICAVAELLTDLYGNKIWHCVSNCPFSGHTRDSFTDENAAIDFLKRSTGGGTPNKEYTGEPNIENYKKRCSDWYRAEGQYSKRKGSEPTLAASFSPMKHVLDDIGMNLFTRRVGFIQGMIVSHPDDLPLADTDPVRGASPLHELAMAPLDDWETGPWMTLAADLHVAQSFDPGEMFARSELSLGRPCVVPAPAASLAAPVLTP